MKIVYEPMFLRRLKALSPSIQNEVIEKTALFEDVNNHQALRVHKLKGRLKERYSFSVAPALCVVFCYSSEKPKEAYLLTVGSHDVYNI